MTNNSVGAPGAGVPDNLRQIIKIADNTRWLSVVPFLPVPLVFPLPAHDL